MNLNICKRNKLIPHNNGISLEIPSRGNTSKFLLITTSKSASKFPNGSAVVLRNVKHATCSTSVCLIPPASQTWQSVMLVNMSCFIFDTITSRCLELNQQILNFQINHSFLPFAFPINNRNQGLEELEVICHHCTWGTQVNTSWKIHHQS